MRWWYEEVEHEGSITRGDSNSQEQQHHHYPGAGETLKAAIGCGDINGRTLDRLRHVIRSERNEQESESYRKLVDCLEKLKATSGGTITDCQVNCDHVGVMRGLRIIGWPWSKLIAHTVRSACSNAKTPRDQQCILHMLL